MKHSHRPIVTLDDLLQAWSRDAFCQCENREEQPEIRCPLDDDLCNCCAYCQYECSKLNAK